MLIGSRSVLVKINSSAIKDDCFISLQSSTHYINVVEFVNTVIIMMFSQII